VAKELLIRRYSGIFLGFISWFIIQRSDASTDAKWRILTLTMLIPAVPLLFVAYLVPESQTFLLKKPDYPAAFKAASQLRNNAILASRDTVASHFQMEAEGELMRHRKGPNRPLIDRLQEPPGICPSHLQTTGGENEAGECVHSYHMTQTNYFDRLWQLFSVPRCRRALICSSCAMLTQGFLCGINVLAFFR
jgi:hypothetical protein